MQYNTKELTYENAISERTGNLQIGNINNWGDKF